MSFVDMPAEKPIPDNERFLEICQEYGLCAARVASTPSRKSCIMIDETLETFLQLMADLKADVLLYHYAYYDETSYLVNKDLIELLEFPVPDERKEDVLAQIDAYDTQLLETLDFERPRSLFIAGALPNARLLCFEINDDWMEMEDENGEIVSRALPSVEALLRIVFPTDEEREAYLSERFSNDAKKEEQLKKSIFEYLVKDPKFQLCTTISKRFHYVMQFEALAPDLFDKVSELYPFEWKKWLEDLVDNVWKLYKIGNVTYNDRVKRILS